MQKKIITLSALVIISGLWFSPFAFGQTKTKTYTIKQEEYTYKMPVTQTVIAETFVITEGSKPDKKTYSKKNKNLDSNIADTSASKNAQKNTVFSTCLFHFDSSTLVPLEAEKILAVLSKREIKKTPLVVTGYTCSLGPDEHNQPLSLQRAKAVADLLRRHGFTVATVQGRGAQNPVTNDFRQLHLNRRVIVQAVKK